MLTGQNDMGILQSGRAHSLTMNGEVLSTLVGGQTRDRRSEGPQSFENLPRESKKGGSVADAIRIAKMGSFQKKVAIFRNNFFAATSARSRACKRAEVVKLAKSVSGRNSILPLSKELVESVAAAHKESGSCMWKRATR